MELIMRRKRIKTEKKEENYTEYTTLTDFSPFLFLIYVEIQLEIESELIFSHQTETHLNRRLMDVHTICISLIRDEQIIFGFK